MSEPTKEANVQQTFARDQAVSINSFFETEINGETLKLQVTSRLGADAAKIAAVVMEHIEALAKLRATYPKPVYPSTGGDPVRVAVDDNGNELPEIKTALAGRLSMDMKDGKTYFKVMDCVFPKGARTTKFGITIWPEALEAAGIEAKTPFPDITGWRVDYTSNDKGYPQKATRLLPPKGDNPF